MRFGHPEVLWALLIIPIMILYARFIRPYNFPTLRYSSTKLLDSDFRPMGSLSLLPVPGWLRTLGVFFLILGLAQPQRGLKTEELSTKATDIVVCLDSSRSMLSVDFKPDNRYSVAKRVVKDFIKGRPHDRIGMVVFGEHAITACPLTFDKTALSDLIDQLEIGVVPADQTAVGVGLATSVNRLKTSQAKSKIIILVTDGANNAGTIDPLTAAKTAASFGIRVYTIGTASTEGGLMPVDDPVFGKRLVPFAADLDEDTLLRIASQTGGRYFRATSSDALKTIFTDIDGLEKTDIHVTEFVDYEDLFPTFLMLSLVFLFLELLLSRTWLRTVP